MAEVREALRLWLRWSRHPAHPKPAASQRSGAEHHYLEAFLVGEQSGNNSGSRLQSR